MQVDPSKKGKLFTVGGENIIHHYGNGYLLKSPIGIRIRLGKENFVNEVVTDFPILKKYLGEFLPEVSVVPQTQNNKPYFNILQKFVEGKVLCEKDLKNQEIKNQFVNLVKQNKEMEEEHKISWDFFGAESLFLGNKSKVANLFITPRNELKIIDIGTMRLERRGQPLLVWAIILWAHRRQKHYLDFLLR
ncbi:hypothetical protein L6255_01525 [Candidatus Parcubacteria bacterium]|nr:hypothetical protein [Patescibacteria group bacterium]MBU4380794.1 hypothetical protein [Patescibacteria group bacterium]MCG2689098.1 hypothetical protein [Candidatus Parcubacteria bacterium]